MGDTSLGFQPTPSQAGHAIGLAVFHLTSQLWTPQDVKSLQSAGITAEQFQAELLLLTAAAAMNAIETAQLLPRIESEVASGLFDWARELPQHLSQLLIATLDDATDYYSEAFAVDQESPRPISDLAEIECAFGDRLLAMGEDNEVRGRACCMLSLVLPKTLWPAQFKSARSMLCDAGLVTVQ